MDDANRVCKKLDHALCFAENKKPTKLKPGKCWALAKFKPVIRWGYAYPGDKIGAVLDDLSTTRKGLGASVRHEVCNLKSGRYVKLRIEEI